MITSITIIVASLAISLIIILIVSVGMRGDLPGDASELTLFMAKTGQHLSGDAEPPAGLVKIVESFPSRGGSASGKN